MASFPVLGEVVRRAARRSRCRTICVRHRQASGRKRI